MINQQNLAIDAALKGNWEEAIGINEKIIKENKEDIDALCRLAYAYSQISDIEKAKKLYKKIINLDKYNNVALKNLSRLSSFKTTYKSKKNPAKFFYSPYLFIEEPGKTKVIQLKNIAPISVLNKLHIGDLVNINPKKHSIEVRTNENMYIGAIPDDISFRLLRFIGAGNKYSVCVKNVQKNQVTVFIREIVRGKKYLNQPSFTTLSIKDYSASAPKEIKKQEDKEEVHEEEEE